MRVLSVKEDYMLQFIVGLNVNMVWRSQPDINFTIPFEEFKSFMDLNFDAVSNILAPYKTALETNDDKLKFKVFMYFLSYCQYNEVVISHYNRLDASIITPYCNTQKTIRLDEIEYIVSKLDVSPKILNSLSAITREKVDSSQLSSHNKSLLMLSIYYMYRSRCAYEQFNVGGLI